MSALNTPVCEFDKAAVDFELFDCDGKVWSLQECKGINGLLVMFICNHCPYVQAILPNLINTALNLRCQGVNSVAIMSNDWDSYPEDSPSKMQELKLKFNFSFPYLIDETQEVAKAYGAVCTPDFFGYNKNLKLQYRGRFDSRGKNQSEIHSDNELEQAMLMIAATLRGPHDQSPSIGCSIKWRNNK